MATLPKSTKIINHFDAKNDIKNIIGTFKYRFFHSHEKSDESGKHITSRPYPDLAARYVTLSWNSDNELYYGLESIFPDKKLVHKRDLFYSIDLQKDFSVYSTRPQEALQEMSEIVSDNSNQASKYDYLLTKIASDEDTSALEENFNNPVSTIPVLDPTTNRPITRTTVSDVQQPPNVIISSRLVNSLIKNSSKSAYTNNNFSSLEQVTAEIQNAIDPDINEKYLSSLDSVFTSLSNLLVYPKEVFNNWVLVGYSISKFRMSGESSYYMYSRLCFRKSYRDNYVAYGKTYRYEIRPVYIKTICPHMDEIGNAIGGSVIFLSSDESSFIDIECKEEKAPSPPHGVKFKYVKQGDIEISWFRPQSMVEDEGTQFDVNDIKGYQVFMRNSLEDSYQLLKYFTFNNTHPASARAHSIESIPTDYIQSSEYQVSEPLPDPYPEFDEPLKYVVPIRSNTDYFFAMCSIDAHGNSSPYSGQFKVRRNNVTGEVQVTGISSPGAPKQYPNLFLQNKLVQPSFSVSGYQWLDVYYVPDTKLTQVADGASSGKIQLFDLTTQIEQVISITMNNN